MESQWDHTFKNNFWSTYIHKIERVYITIKCQTEKNNYSGDIWCPTNSHSHIFYGSSLEEILEKGESLIHVIVGFGNVMEKFLELEDNKYDVVKNGYLYCTICNDLFNDPFYHYTENHYKPQKNARKV
jgi:hypothetical protein